MTEQIVMARVRADSKISSVRAFGGKDYVKGEWAPVPEHFLDQLPHPMLETAKFDRPAKPKPVAPVTVQPQGLPQRIVDALIEAGYSDPMDAVEELSDEELLEIPGIGSKSVELLRVFAAAEVIELDEDEAVEDD